MLVIKIINAILTKTFFIIVSRCRLEFCLSIAGVDHIENGWIKIFYLLWLSEGEGIAALNEFQLFQE